MDDNDNKEKGQLSENETAETETEQIPETEQPETPETEETEPEAEEPETAAVKIKEPMPHKKKMAVWRCCLAAAFTLAILLLTNFGAFHLMFGGKDLTPENLVPNRYLTFNVDTVIDYLAEDYKNGTDASSTDASSTDASATDDSNITGRYVIIPCQNKLVVIHLPQRYLEDSDTIAVQTYYQLYNGAAADKYFVVSGTVKKAPDEIVQKYAAWYKENALYMYQYGFIKDLDQTTLTYMVDVDSTGIFGDTACTVITCFAGALFIYAILELIFILKGRYNDDITVEIFEDDSPDAEGGPDDDGEEPEEEPETEPEAEPEAEEPADGEEPEKKTEDTDEP